ncbi:MAG: TVP38/TMEM64 family protein, partial [bacterium]
MSLPSQTQTSQKDPRRWLLAVVIALGVLLFFFFDLQRFLTLEYLQASRESFTKIYAESPLTVSLIYFLIYVASTALSVPGAVVLTLAGGALFGLGWGLVLVSFASSLGATLAMMASRFVLRDAVQNRFGSQLQRINEGVEKQGAFYLFTLRLV